MDTFLTSDQLDTLLAATVDYHERNGLVYQNMQDKPLLRDMSSNTGSFPGNPGKTIRWETVLEYVRAEHGWEGDQRLTFINPTGIRKCHSIAKNRHLGLTVSHDEIAENGVRMVNTIQGWSGRDHAKAAAVKLHDLLSTKVKIAMEGRAIDRNEMLWLDGTNDRLNIPGVKYWIHDDPTVPMVVGGLDQGALPAWRNRAALGIAANAGNASENVLVQKLQSEWRQLIRYGGKPTKAYCGSDFIEQLERELRARGSYTEAGWAKSGTIDVSMADIAFKGMRFEYDPTLDDFGEAKRMYWLNIGGEGLQLLFMNGEKEIKHEPPREHDRLVTYVSFTTTMGTRMRRRQNSGAYSIA